MMNRPSTTHTADAYAPHWALYPQTYFVRPVPKASDPIDINGDLTKSVWQGVPWSEPFGDIQGTDNHHPAHSPARTRFQALYNDTHLMIGAVLDPSPDFPTQAHFTQRNEPIFQKDSDFEVFIDVFNRHHQYKELELNALNTVWNLCLDKPYWDGGSEHSGRIAQPGEAQYYEVYHQQTAARVLSGTLNDEHEGAQWSVELALAYEDLYSKVSTGADSDSIMPPRGRRPSPGTMWRINFSRVELKGEVNWTWQPQRVWDPSKGVYEGKIDMHLPDAWGYLVFVDGDEDNNGMMIPHEDPRHAPSPYPLRDPLWPLRLTCINIYYAQRHYHDQNHTYTNQLADLAVDPDIVKPFDIQILANGENDSYEVTVRELHGTHAATIRQDRLLTILQTEHEALAHTEDDLLPHMVDTDNEDMDCVMGACFLERPEVAHVQDSLPSVRRRQIVEEDCRDVRQDCAHRVHECTTNALIRASCPQACQEDCSDRMEPIHPKDKNSKGNDDPKYIVQEGVGADFGILQSVPPLSLEPQHVSESRHENADNNQDSLITVSREKLIERAHAMAEYMQNRQEAPTKTSVCRNNHTMCLQWAIAGECKKNPGWMLQNCGPACFHCIDTHAVQ